MQRKLTKSLVWKQWCLWSWEDVTSSPPMWILISFNQQQLPENRITTNPEYANTQQDLPDTGILSPISRHAKLFGSGVCFAEKLLILDPYFQYFSANWVDPYNLGLPSTLEHTWLITLSFQSTTAITHILNFSLPIPLFTTMWQRDQGSHIRESRRIDSI